MGRNVTNTRSVNDDGDDDDGVARADPVSLARDCDTTGTTVVLIDRLNDQ